LDRQHIESLFDMPPAPKYQFTVKVTLLVVPPDVVTVTLRPLRVAAPLMVKVVVIVVEFTTVTALWLTPPPEIPTVAPLVKFVPVSVTGTDVPRVPEVGLIEVRVGGGAFTMVNVTLLVVPEGVTTDTFRAVRLAPAEIVNVAVTVESFTTVKPLAVTPPPDTFTAVAPVSRVPVRVTETDVPLAPEAGAIEVRVAPVTVKGSLLLVPPGLVTLTFLDVRAAPFVMLKVAVS